MKNINKQVNSASHFNEFSGIYSQVKEIEKNMEAALQLLLATYQASLTKVKQSTEHVVQTLHAYQQEAMIRLDALKDQLIGSVESRWAEFKQYSRLLRRVCFGQQSDRLMSVPDFEGLQCIISSIYSRLDSFEGIAQQASKKLPEIEQYIRTHLRNCDQALQPSDLKIEKHFLEISPIKEKNKQSNEQSNVHLKQLSTVELLVEQMRSNPKQRKIKTETCDYPSLQRRQLNQRANLRQLIPPQSTSLEISRAPASKTRRVAPQMPTYHLIKPIDIPKFAGTGRLQRFGTTKVNSVEEQFKAGSPSSFTRRNKQLTCTSQRREDLLTSSGQDYKNCLQKLQRQQLEYEKLRKGLA